MIPLDSRLWAHSLLIQILTIHHIGTVGKHSPTPTGPQQSPTINQHIPPPQI